VAGGTGVRLSAEGGGMIPHTFFSGLLSFADPFRNARALAKCFLRHAGIYRSDVSFHLLTPGRDPASRSGRCQGIGHAGKNVPCPSSAMSCGRLFLDRVGRHQRPSPLHRHPQINMHPSPAPPIHDISTLPAGRHFYFALTTFILYSLLSFFAVILCCQRKVEMSYSVPSRNVLFGGGAGEFRVRV
jgi:hypothetical protein